MRGAASCMPASASADNAQGQAQEARVGVDELAVVRAPKIDQEQKPRDAPQAERGLRRTRSRTKTSITGSPSQVDGNSAPGPSGYFDRPGRLDQKRHQLGVVADAARPSSACSVVAIASEPAPGRSAANGNAAGYSGLSQRTTLFTYQGSATARPEHARRELRSARSNGAAPCAVANTRAYSASGTNHDSAVSLVASARQTASSNNGSARKSVAHAARARPLPACRTRSAPRRTPASRTRKHRMQQQRRTQASAVRALAPSGALRSETPARFRTRTAS